MSRTNWFVKSRALLIIAASIVFPALVAWGENDAGSDLPEVFARAHRGGPLRYVAIGGSITQAGEGWIDGWLRKQFPQSSVTTVNAGMSATGSELGVFRVDRDVIGHQPDLVAIEFCVNDGDVPDEDAVRNIESLVVRLKQLAHPPAIIMLVAAKRAGANLQRHRRVARHYGLLEVDLQQAVDNYLKEDGKSWESLFSDDVHPNQSGHEFYANAIAAALEPFVPPAKAGTRAGAGSKPLPSPLSTKPLLLDGRIVPLSGIQGWTSESSLPAWWTRFFLGVLSADAPGTALVLPLRGTTLGVFYAMDESFGSFYASVDGAPPAHIFTNFRNGYSYSILSRDLPAEEHLMTLLLPRQSGKPSRANGPVKLGYALVAGESRAGREHSPQGIFTLNVLQQLTFSDIPAKDWSWSGPYAVGEKDALPLIHQVFDPEKVGMDVRWKNLADQQGGWINFRQVTGSDNPGLVYAATHIETTVEETALLGLTVDYYAKLWVNGKLIVTFDGFHGPSGSPQFFPVTLRPGSNEILIKVGSGSQGFGFSVSLAKLPAKGTPQESRGQKK